MILAIESSCDESALALFHPTRGVVGNWIHSQVALHEAYGGVVPDLASREHLRNLPALLGVSRVVEQKDKITQIAVTEGPGLAGCLALGIAFAKSLSLTWKVPVIGVNHLRG
ncbi:MAG: tRNA (adenosine(37)-N6)-threonylcarbamoyltransferase complex transferase subunit TsaD, partial [Verrucomicrobiota bacterium]